MLLLKQTQALDVALGPTAILSPEHPTFRRADHDPEISLPRGAPAGVRVQGLRPSSAHGLPPPTPRALSRAPGLDGAARAPPGIQHLKVVSLPPAVLAWSRPRRPRRAARSGAAGGSLPGRSDLRTPEGRPLSAAGIPAAASRPGTAGPPPGPGEAGEGREGKPGLERRAGGTQRTALRDGATTPGKA